MRKVRVPGRPFLLAMGPHRVDISAVEKCLTGMGIVALDPVDQVILPHHGRLGGVPRSLRLFRYLGGGIKVAPEWRLRPGLVLHSRQIAGRARHSRLLRTPAGEGVSEQDIMANVNGGKMRAAADDGTFRPLTMQHGHSRAEWTARNP